MASNTYRDLIVWQKAMDLVVDVYAIASQLPNYEKYALADQIRRAVVSIPSNIAEGQRRSGNKEIVQFSSIALGSVAEVETQLILVRKLHNLDTSKVLERTEEVGKMLSGLIRKLRLK